VTLHVICHSFSQVCWTRLDLDFKLLAARLAVQGLIIVTIGDKPIWESGLLGLFGVLDMRFRLCCVYRFRAVLMHRYVAMIS